MNPQIYVELKKFEALQHKHAEVGAEDSEPSYMFQLVIAHAVNKTPVEVGEDLDWDLYEDMDHQEAALELTEQAWTAYLVVQRELSENDIPALRKYCWRIDDQEFSP